MCTLEPLMLNAVISLWPHESFDKRDNHRAQLLQHNEEWIETSED